MGEKKNLLWRLDLLEHHFLNTKVRFARTKALLKAKGKKKAHLLPESKDEAIKEIEGLKLDILERKIHSSLVKYNRAIKKSIKAMPTKTNKDELEFLKSLDIDQISTIRIVKSIQSIFKLNPKRIEYAPGFVPDWIIDIVKDKTNVKNPSHFYNSLTPEQRNWYSKLMNKKDVQAIADIIENSFKIVFGPTGKHNKKDIEDVETTDSESDDDDESNDSVDSGKVKNLSKLQDDDHADSNEDDDFEKYAEFDNLIAGSDEDNSDVELDNTINYNEVTDEEPSDVEEEEDEEDDFFVEHVKEKKEKKEKTTKKEKKEKIKLPELQYGYISGSDDEDIDEDEVVKNATQPKKNRRGQRARQKIWEQKYGRGAKHIQKEKEKVRLEREQKQREYEERVAKRAAKAAITGSNSTPLGERKNATTGSEVEPKQEKELHPSWIAKKKQEEALKNVKFSGKKIVF
ncbi:Bud22p [Cyberlindnera jadinii NRRL Y-1542]|uniref:Bud-site selection protein n=1 Tax=Cyberlindnera jadinii (strain ATCC 18201 / CBS 1600 / BCRC 20928 / JCM 3617 / NBRC 0987 / NRRL Y-1542) TaxID=983966 RepID=A0A1E4RVV5_CYBJN|nr:Bud-site selection protein [Cyberlindnera jadinii NRRL Y-1542]ODV71407.1 Bud-site selection protein [Cyberlindnera jadinii NRRL Y-1542]